MDEVIGRDLSIVLKALSKMAYPKEDRPHMNRIRMDGGAWVATSGHAMMVVEVECDVDALIPLKAAKDMIALSKGDKLSWQIDAEGSRFFSASRDISLAWECSEQFPPWRKTIPQDERAPCNPSFATGLMRTAMDALLVLGCPEVTMHTADDGCYLIEGRKLGLGDGDFVKSARVVLMGVRV